MRCKSIGALARKFLPLLHCCLYWRLKYPFSIVAFPLQLQKSICKCLEACHAYVSIIFAGRFGPRYHSWPWRQMKEPGRFKSRVRKLLPDLHQDTKPTRYTPFKGPLILVVLNFQKMCPCSESRTNSSAKEKGAKGQKGRGRGRARTAFVPEPGHLGQEVCQEGTQPMPSWQTWQLQLHNRGKCFPCIAFALKPAGCFKGDECRHCHFCNGEQAKARRRQLQQAARRQKRRLGIS